MDQSLFLNQIMPQLCRGLDINLFESELALIKKIEKTMDPQRVFEEKWKIATSGDRYALAKYHSNILSKKAIQINEAISQLSKEEYDALNLKLESFREVLIGILKPIHEHLRMMINENDALAFTAPAKDAVDFSKLEKGATAASGAPSNWTIIGVANSILKAMTNNYSALGILQLVLDIVGIVGDYIIPGLGMAADIINSIIYFYNGEYVLGVISLIAVIPGAGDAAKAAKPFANPLQKFFGFLFKGNSKGAATLLGKVPGLENVVRAIFTVLKGSGKVITDAARAFNGLLKWLLSVIPSWLGGAKIQKFFDWIDDALIKFKGTLDGVDATAKKALDEAAAMAKLGDPALLKQLGDINSQILKNGGTIAEEGADIVFKAADGSILGKFPANQILDTKTFLQKFPGATAKTTQVPTGLLDASGKPIMKDATAYSYLVAKTSSTPKFLNWLSKAFSKSWNKRSLIGIGKLIYKYWNAGDENVEIEGTDVPALDDADYAYVSAAALTDYVQQTISERRKKTGEIYNPTVVFNSLDKKEKDGFDFSQSYLRDMARKTGQPSIIPVIYDKYKTEMEPEEREAMEETFAELIAKEREEKEEREETPTPNRDVEKEIEGIAVESYSIKNRLTPFSKFK